MVTVSTKTKPEYDPLPDYIRVAMGGRKSSNIAHFFVTDEAYKKGQCLCGRTLKPKLEMTHWDLNYQLVRDATCPDCLYRARLLKYAVRFESKNLGNNKK